MPEKSTIKYRTTKHVYNVCNKMRYKEKCAKCRLILLSGDVPALFEISDIELLNILRITCDIIRGPYGSRKLDSQRIGMSHSPNCKTRRAPQIKKDRKGMHGGKRYVSAHFKSVTNRVAGKRTDEVSRTKIYNKFSAVFQR